MSGREKRRGRRPAERGTALRARLLAASAIALAGLCGAAAAQEQRPAQPRRAAPAPAQPAQAPQQPPTAPAQAAAPAQPAPPQPQRTEILPFDNWTLTCQDFAEGPNRRVCTATLRVQNQSNQVLFAWTVGLNAEKKLVSVFQVPSGVLLEPGIQLKLAGGAQRKIPFVACEPGRCEATTPMDERLIREVGASETVEATVQGTTGQGVQFKFPVKGFDRAIAGVKG